MKLLRGQFASIDRQDFASILVVFLLVSAVVDGISTVILYLIVPGVGAIVGSDLQVGSRTNTIYYGLVIGELAVAFLIYRLVLAIAGRRRSSSRECPACLSTVPKAARRCAFCAEELTPVSSAV